MNSVTLIGNLTAEPELRYTPAGEAVANMSVAVSRRVRQDGEWRDELDGYFRCVAFGGLGEHAAESLKRGTRVLVTGRLRQDSYEDSEGTRRTAFEIVLEDVAPALRFAKATVTKASGNGGQDAPAPVAKMQRPRAGSAPRVEAGTDGRRRR